MEDKCVEKEYEPIELKKLTDFVCQAFEISSPNDLPERTKQIVLENKTEYYEEFCNIVGDLSIDWLQKIFQYYLADRKEKMQYYTPVSLAKMVAKLSMAENETMCLDMCAGSGALTIQKWNQNKKLSFWCREYDENVVPILLFNLAVRNINAYVEQCDVLQNTTQAMYKVTKGKQFATVSITNEMPKGANSCISNPPFNVKWQPPCFAQLQKRFQKCSVPPDRNANLAFVLTAIADADKAVMILPNNVLTPKTASEKDIIRYLVEANLIEAVITCPGQMFECTNMPTCIILINRNKSTALIEMIDMRQTYATQIREQNGQYGGNNHEKRTYKKEFKIFTDEHIQKAVDVISNHAIERGFSKAVTIEEIKTNDYLLITSRYIEMADTETKHREYTDIIKDLNRVIQQKNLCKLTISETLAKAIGLDVSLYKKDTTDNQLNNVLEKVSGQKMQKHDYISFTKNKNEVKFENNSKTVVSSIFMLIFSMWKQHVYFLNQEENRYLVELRDKMLPELMSGKLEV